MGKVPREKLVSVTAVVPQGERAEAGSMSASADLMRTYLGEIGTISLLKAKDEVELGRRIEAAQLARLRALAEIAMVIVALEGIGGRLRRREAAAHDVLAALEGELSDAEVKRIRRGLARSRGLRGQALRAQRCPADGPHPGRRHRACTWWKRTTRSRAPPAS
jgi:hypothetical protein